MTSRLKEYEIICKIGQGSFGTVFKVRRKLDRLILVIKFIKINNLSKKNQQDSLHEVNILSSLNCPYIVKYYDSFVENSTLHIVMEYCEKGDLSQILKKQQLNQQKIWKFFIQISIGLEYLHSKQILHRDIKCLNIFLSNDESIRIGDLGVAKILNNTHAFAQTQVGSPYYLSPELCEEKPYNAKSDVWALGCVLYEMCTKTHPFQASTQAALLLKIIKGSYQGLSSEFSSSLRDIVDLCLEKDYTKRPNISTILQRPEIQSMINSFAMNIPNSSVLHKSKTLTSERYDNIPDRKINIYNNDIKTIEDVQKQLSENRKNISGQALDEKIKRPLSANRSDLYGLNKKPPNFCINDIILKEKSPPKVQNIIIKKPLNGLLMNQIKKIPIENINNGIFERKSEKEIQYLKKKSIKECEDKLLYKEQASANDLNKAYPIKNNINQGKDPSEVKKIENFPEDKNKIHKIERPNLKLYSKNQNKDIGMPEDLKQIFRSKIPLTAKASKLNCSYEDIKLVQDLPEIPKIKQKVNVKYLKDYSPVKIMNPFIGKTYYKALKKPIVELLVKNNPITKVKNNRIEKKNNSIDEIILDTNEIDQSSVLRQKELESVKNSEELQRKCSNLRRDIIKMIGIEIFNEMHNIFTKIIAVRYK